MKRYINIVLWLLYCHLLPAQVLLVNNKSPSGRIVLTSDNKADVRAGYLLQDFVERISGAKLPVQNVTEIKENDIVIGNDGFNKFVSKDGLSEDGFRLVYTEHTLRIVNGGGKGSIYAVVSLLERYFGVSYWGEKEYSLTPSSTLKLPKINITEIPSFRYRQTQNYAIKTDPIYEDWMRLRNSDEVFASNLWVHTFSSLVSSDIYGQTHPEYFSYFNGKRHPGKASQLCLSNPEVLKIVTQKLDSIFKANPDKNLISVSQNDSNFTFCQCDECKAIDTYEGAPSGSIIHFVNKLAKRFPNKRISTLAYLYSMNPPLHIRPADNVNVMLCSIDSKREVPLTKNESGKEFVKALNGWSKITKDLFVWDYGINFDNFVSPFPNFHILGENMRLFHKRNTSMLFTQIAGSRGGDFSELRTWLVSKLMWDVNQNENLLIQTFLKGYYGNAAPYLYQYIKLMEHSLLESGMPLWIYDSPVSHKDGMLKQSLLIKYNKLFDKAELAVSKDSILLKRVWRTRLPLQYSELEIARTNPKMDKENILQKLSLFENRVRLFSVPELNERGNSPLNYCSLYRKRYVPSEKRTIPIKSILFNTLPSGKYVSLGSQITDNLYGGMSFTEGWVGWEGRDAEFILDLGTEKEFKSVHADFLHQLGAWVLAPSKVTYSISNNGIDFQFLKSIDNPEDKSQPVKFVDLSYSGKENIKARYIKVNINAIKTCPDWHYGVGNPCWFFIDEIWIE